MPCAGEPGGPAWRSRRSPCGSHPKSGGRPNCRRRRGGGLGAGGVRLRRGRARCAVRVGTGQPRHRTRSGTRLLRALTLGHASRHALTVGWLSPPGRPPGDATPSQKAAPQTMEKHAQNAVKPDRSSPAPGTYTRILWHCLQNNHPRAVRLQPSQTHQA